MSPGCTYSDAFDVPRAPSDTRVGDEIKALIFGRLMSDYEVTLVNDNSMRSLRTPLAMLTSY